MKRHNRHGMLVYALLLALLLPILAACGGQPAATSSDATSAPAGGAPDATQTPAADGGQTTDPPSSNSLRIAASLGTWPDTLAPQKTSFSNEIAVLLLNYEGLTRFDKDLKTVPAAAESWEYNQDATQITFHLRDGLKYSDGSPI